MYDIHICICMIQQNGTQNDMKNPTKLCYCLLLDTYFFETKMVTLSTKLVLYIIRFFSILVVKISHIFLVLKINQFIFKFV